MFERKRRPSVPGDIIRAHYLDEHGVSVAALGRALGVSRKHMSDIVNGRSRIAPTGAARLAKVFGTSTALWLNLQAAVSRDRQMHEVDIVQERDDGMISGIEGKASATVKSSDFAGLRQPRHRASTRFRTRVVCKSWGLHFVCKLRGPFLRL